jgi:hypothetical protein
MSGNLYSGRARADSRFSDLERLVSDLARRVAELGPTSSGPRDGHIDIASATAHGWDLMTAVGMTATGWETAAPGTSYRARGIVVGLAGADDALVLRGRGALPPDHSYAAGDRLYLQSAGTLGTDETDDPWLDIDAGDLLTGTILPPSAAAGAGDYITLTLESHGFTAGYAVGSTTAAADDWELAIRENYFRYIRRGIVTEVINADTVVILIGRGTYTSGYDAGDRLFIYGLSSGNAGKLSRASSYIDYPWCDIDPDDATKLTIVPAWQPNVFETGSVLTVEKTGHGWSVADLVVLKEALSPIWYEVTNVLAPPLGTELKRGVVLGVISADKVRILVEGRGVLASSSLEENKVYGMIQASDQPAYYRTNVFFEPWFITLPRRFTYPDAHDIYLLPYNRPANRNAKIVGNANWATITSFPFRSGGDAVSRSGGSRFSIAVEMSATVDSEDVVCAAVGHGFVGLYQDTPGTVDIAIHGKGTEIIVETKVTSTTSSHNHTYLEWRTSEHHLSPGAGSWVTLNASTWTAITSLLTIYDSSGNVWTCGVQAMVSTSPLAILFRLVTSGSPTVSGTIIWEY